jgi:hypothetical protein
MESSPSSELKFEDKDSNVSDVIKTFQTWTGGAGVTRGDTTTRTRGTRGARRKAASRHEVEAPVNGRRRRDERRRDNQPDEGHERGRWRRKQQQLQLCNNQQKEMGRRNESRQLR